MSDSLKSIIESAYENRNQLSVNTMDASLHEAILTVMGQLDRGELRVAEKQGDKWIVHEWIKKAVLLSFRVQENQLIEGGFTRYFDKSPLKYAQRTFEEFVEQGTRVVPPACARRGWRRAFVLRSARGRSPRSWRRRRACRRRSSRGRSPPAGSAPA